MNFLRNAFASLWENVDWTLLISALLISCAGLVTMNSFTGTDRFFAHQLVWLALSLCVFFICSFIDWRFLRKTWVVAALYVVSCAILTSLFILGSVFKGAQSWFNLGAFAFQPSDPVKLVIVILLSKYFTRRHIEIANIRHILVSGLYAFVLFLLVLLQPDFGSAVIIFCLWLGMVLVSGISKKHLAAVFALGLIAFSGLWLYVLQPYQKARIQTFINPLTDIQGAGYHAYQSMIAVGSGQIFGKGIGYGTQSKLRFLPEYQTDFIFAAFAEEWGFIGVVLLIAAFGVLIWRVIKNAMHGSTNFEILFGAGVAILLITQFMVHVGMNIGLLPVTGKTFPFMSYGGSHLLTEYLALGMLMGMRRYRRAVHKERVENEIIGVGA
jgi:rod shape determining protein RodA